MSETGGTGSTHATQSIVRGRMARAGVVCTFAFALAVHANAAPTPEDSALATELFKQGRELMAAGKPQEACPKLAESHRLDPGGGTVMNLGLCYEAIGKLASAYSAFNDALAMGRRDDREDRVTIATEHIAHIEPRLSRVVILVPPAADIPGLAITREGSEVARAAWGSAMPVDGGSHEVVVMAAGHQTWRRTITVQNEGDKQTVVVPRLERLPEPDPVAPPPNPTPVVRAVHRRPPVEDGNGRVQRTWGFIVGGAGVLGVGAGSYFGLRALSKRDDSEASCRNGCTVRGSELSNEATTNADVSTASFVIGAAALGLGAYLVLSAETDGASVGLVVAPSSAAVRGRF